MVEFGMQMCKMNNAKQAKCAVIVRKEFEH